ncbi:UBX domain [Trypanosoma vivax]|uniref:UBX domain-containing protein n=1 Tax=Trypanosoma vivax (strain Y486) TaxID=1055687 RepID=G0U3S3_TRYVY|nr:hypothetical protein TRVL_02275 [Trypanosoma vivax]KAH8614172.1 UBX domain [Trypanosoma vivax]CCC50932.1 conserved hypothetical protein [Trypanosoma vivax Y486]
MSIASEIQSRSGLRLHVASGSLEEARREALDRGVYLLVYLHCPTHENTNTFIDDVLQNTPLREILETRFVFFASSVMEETGHRLALDFEATTFPCLFVQFRHRTLLKVQGLLAPDDLLRHFTLMFDHFDSHLAAEVVLRNEREARLRRQAEEEQRLLDMEAVDRERIRQYEEKNRARRAQLLASVMSSEVTMREQLMVEEATELGEICKELTEGCVRYERSQVLLRLPPEPPKDADPSTVVTISIRSLCGKQHRRRFYRTDSLGSLRDYAISLEDYNGSGFDLITGYPPRPLETDGNKSIGEVPLLLPSAVVLMHPV